MRIKIASRKSDLARLQSYRVGQALKEANPAIDIEYIFRSSLGDLNQRDPLWKMPEKGVFTEDFVEGLKSGEFDLVVHSWKDLPTAPREKTELVATLDRADQRDLILFRKDVVTGAGKSHLRILSSSPRREFNLSSFLKNHLPEGRSKKFEFVPVRGNILTRLEKLIQGDGDALVLAKAALDRLLLATESEFKEGQERILEILDQCQWIIAPLSLNPTAAAQGAIVVEARKGREDLKDLFLKINNQLDFQCVQYERDKLSEFGGGCHLKLGISVVNRNSEQFFFSRGETPEGESFAISKSLHIEKVKAYSTHELWPNPDSPQLFERKALEIDTQKLSQANAIVVSRIGPGLDKLLPLIKDKVVWAAGTQTWQKLSEMGVWVNGSFDGIGQYLPDVDHLARKKLEWVKLTHDQNEGNGITPIAYYQLLPKSIDSSHLTNKKSFFWMSYSSFQRAIEIAPEIKERGEHACGPGQTADLLRKELGHDRVSIYLSYEEWFNRLSSKP